MKFSQDIAILIMIIITSLIKEKNLEEMQNHHQNEGKDEKNRRLSLIVIIIQHFVASDNMYKKAEKIKRKGGVRSQHFFLLHSSLLYRPFHIIIFLSKCFQCRGQCTP